MKLRPPVLCAIAIAVAGCATGPAPRTPIEPPDTAAAAHTAVAEAAESLVGRTNLRFADRRYTFDCSGAILAAHYLAGVPVDEAFARQSGGGVVRLHALSRAAEAQRGVAHPDITPGAVVFWDNTYDRNGDGLWNDPLTHAGIVVDVATDGTVTVVHHNYRRGIVYARMNPGDPGDRELNDAMRMRGQIDPGREAWSAGHLYRSVGYAYLAGLNESGTIGLH